MRCRQCGSAIDEQNFLKVCEKPSVCYQRAVRSMPAMIPPEKWAPIPAPDVAAKAREALRQGLLNSSQEPKTVVPPNPVPKLQPVTKPVPVKKQVSRYDVSKLTPDEMVGAVPLPPPEVVAARQMEPVPSKPVADVPEVKIEPEVKAEPTQPVVKPKERRRYTRIKAGDLQGLKSRIAHYLIEVGGERKPVPGKKLYHALNLRRYSDWKRALEELIRDGILRRGKKGIKVVGADKLLTMEAEQVRLEAARKEKAKRKRRPRSQWFQERIDSFRERDGMEPEEDEGQRPETGQQEPEDYPVDGPAYDPLYFADYTADDHTDDVQDDASDTGENEDISAWELERSRAARRGGR